MRAAEYSPSLEKKPRPQQEQALNCPRCNSINTKFCYYNNYSLSQPRYFCKSCRRYWTAGGSLRNIPVGGTSRKNKRSSSSSSPSCSSIPTKKLIPDLSPPKFPPQNPKIYDGKDLNLSYTNPPIYNGISELVALPFALNPQNPNSSVFKTAGGLSSLISAPVSISNSSGFQMHDFRPSLSFSQENRFGNSQSTVGTASRILFPFEESRNDDRFSEQQNGYWSGMRSW